MSTLSSSLHFSEASDFLHECYEKDPAQLVVRLAALERHDFQWNTQEIIYAGKCAWRNSTRCIGRLFWPTLRVQDQRHIQTSSEAALVLFDHLKQAFAGGKIQSVMTVLPSHIRVLNPQLMCYAGYETSDGVCGDGAHVELTRFAQQLGWQGTGGSFDLLPLLIEVDNIVTLHPLPKEVIYEVDITHPNYPDWKELQLKWYAIPAISDAILLLAGQSHRVVFNGWYMGTEIAARDLTDTNRYDQLPRVARLLGLDMTHERTLWRDRALVELNVAVLTSFREAGVQIVDHHTAAQQFVRFQEKEAERGRNVKGKWSWLIPPLSPATTPIWSQRFDAKEESPRFLRCPFTNPS